VFIKLLVLKCLLKNKQISTFVLDYEETEEVGNCLSVFSPIETEKKKKFQWTFFCSHFAFVRIVFVLFLSSNTFFSFCRVASRLNKHFCLWRFTVFLILPFQVWLKFWSPASGIHLKQKRKNNIVAANLTALGYMKNAFAVFQVFHLSV